jgi:hypothetical protein
MVSGARATKTGLRIKAGTSLLGPNGYGMCLAIAICGHHNEQQKAHPIHEYFAFARLGLLLIYLAFAYCTNHLHGGVDGG